MYSSVYWICLIKLLSELEYMSVEIWHTDTKKKNENNGREHPKTVRQLQMCNISIILIPEEERERSKETFNND